MDNEVVRQLRDTQANLKARRLLPAAEAIERGLSVIAIAEEARQEAVRAASVIPGLRSEVASLKVQIGRLQNAVAKAQDEAKLAAVPKLEALAEARAETRDLIRPFLQGDTGTRMLALTIWRELDAKWGKEVSNGR